MKIYTIWLKAAIIVQFIATIIHATTLFINPTPDNATEKQLYSLMDSYKFNLGAGFYRSMGEMTLALSACFCFFCLLAGMINWYLLRKRVEPGVIKGIIDINLFVFGICFVLVTIFTFLLPIVLIGLIMLFLILSRFSIPKTAKSIV
jgi:hypothetical protein